ncbi:hypothetical protein MHBO_004373 [Bonamia ostreae]|uniref:Uncharacterized protein n=1 Tax=Bonamia ostreae TaxID=126728 RepID=A0ABV2AT62_9EUKA
MNQSIFFIISPLYLGVYAVEYNKPPTQHYLNIQLDHPHFSSTGYESIKPGPHNGGTDSTSRPKTASANSLAFDKIPDKRIENN